MSTSPPVDPGTPDPARLSALRQTPDAREPVRYTGELQPDPNYYDGRLPHAVGVHHVQVFRATRAPAGGHPGFTYNHQPFLVWWNGRFYLQFLGAAQDEHQAPTLTFWCTSADGYRWSDPQIAFPEYRLPAFKLGEVAYPAGMSAVMHQRMGFYVAPNGRLLMLGFYGICPDSEHSPNAGNGIGRVVREIRADGALGDIYFIRYNRHMGFDEANTRYPFFATSSDNEFRAACEALLADKLATLQWWEEDRGRDGFFPINPSAVADAPLFKATMVTSAGAGKAFTWYTRPDGVVVGLWKNQYSALSADHGRTWTPIVRNSTLRTTGAKTWGQRTSDGRFVIVYNHSATGANRFPIAALVGSDGHEFPDLLCLGGEVPPRRYAGKHRGPGMHYFRGISEGSRQPPDAALWIAYSMNKEDIWVLRAHVPLSATESASVLSGEIEGATSIASLVRWNFHLPRWAGADIASDSAIGMRVLELRDEDPWDYAQAERVFAAGVHVQVRFQICALELSRIGSFEVELQTQRHERPVRLCFTAIGVRCEDGTAQPRLFAFSLDRWQLVELECDAAAGSFTLKLDNTIAGACIPFAEAAPVLERIVFRTGPWRGKVPAHLVDGTAAQLVHLPGEDIGADRRVDPTVVRIAGLTIAGE